MKIPTITLLGCALLLAPLSAQDEKGKGRPEGRGDGSFFKNLDTDGDGGISQSEAGERWERLGKLDKDKDGKVTMAEMRDGFAGGRPDGNRPGAGKPDGDKPKSDRPDGDKPKSDRPDGDKPKSDRPDGDKPKGDRPDGDKPKGDRPGAGRPGDGKAKGMDFFKNADKNSDGKLSQDEVPEQMWGRISQLDKNEDGGVSLEEMAAMRRDGGPGGPGGKGDGRPGNPAEMLKRMDTNGDGNIGKDEVPAEAWARMSRLDKNADDMISKEEFAAARDGMQGKGGRPGAGGTPGGPDAIFGKFDEDKDGKLSSTEVPAEMWDKVSKADTDADGLVSKDEMREAYKKMSDYKGDKKPEERKKEDKPEA